MAEILFGTTKPICLPGQSPNDIVTVQFLRSSVQTIIECLKSPDPNPKTLRDIADGFSEQLAYN